jgi:3',5'-cyclic AMP phosphodiesterase CpdA
MRHAAAIAILVVLTAPQIPAASAEPSAAELLSGPYVIAPRTDGATVCWQTVGAAPGRVRYRPSGSAKWIEAAGRDARFQAVSLTGLKPATAYQVEVLSGGTRLGALTFGTAPLKLESFTFYVYGDTRSNPRAHGAIAAGLAAEARRRKQPTFVLTTGDLARYESDEDETAGQFFVPARPYLEIMPLVPLRGNHECGADLFKKYFPAPPRPPAEGNPDDFVVDYGSVRVVVLDQYGPARTGGPRMKWLADRLAEAADRWRIVAFHEPMFSSGSHGPNGDWRDLIMPVLREGRVHAVFCGHDHDYERVKPQHGVTQFVTGGGGAPLRDIIEEPHAYSAKFQAVYHFMTVDVTPEKLVATAHAYSPSGGKAFEVIDSVEIPRDCGWGSAKADVVDESAPRHTREVLYGLEPSPWRNALKKWLMIGGIALLALAIALKSVQIARHKPDAKAKS